VLFDAVAILPSENGAALLAAKPAARDFVADAVAHHKFIAYVETAVTLFEKAGGELDECFIHLEKPKDCPEFVTQCRKLRFWKRRHG
jgi:catalase